MRLKGDSGNGKTSIVRAIEWVLYGTGDHNPNGMTDAKTVVGLKCPFFEVERRSNPKSLIVSPLIDAQILPISSASAMKRHPSMLYDAAAQVFIDKAMGRCNVWKGSLSVDEDERHVFMTGSAQDKRTFIDSLVYRDDDPNETIDKYKLHIKMLKERLRDTEVHLSSMQGCVKEDHECPIMPSKSAAELHKEIQEHAVAIKRANEQIQRATEHAKKEAEMVAITSQIASMGELPPTAEVASKIRAMETAAETRKKYSAQLTERSYLQSQLQGVDVSTISPVDVLKKRRQEYNARKTHVELATSLEMDYTFEAISGAISRLEKEVKTLKADSATRKEYLFLVEKLNALKQNVPPLVSADEISSIRAEIASIDLSGDCDMSCPECNTPLKVVNKALVKGAAIKYTKKELDAIKTRYDKLYAQAQALEAKNEKRLRDLVEIGRLEAKIGTYAVVPVEMDYEQEISAALSAIKLCKTIKILPEVNAVLDADFKLAEMAEALAKLKIPSTIPDEPDVVLLSELRSRLSMCKMRDELTKQVSSITAGLSSSVDVEAVKADIARREVLTTTLHQDVALWNSCSEHVNCDKYTDLLISKIELQDDIYVTDLILASCRDVQMSMMDKKIATLNDTITALMPEFFSEGEGLSMTVAVKESKIGKNTVPDVTLSITLNGVPIKRPSRGQNERLGLCLSLASARLLGAKILVCDENFTKISELKRDDCFKLVRKILQDIPILAMSPDDPDGLFDQIIPCERSLWNVK